MAAVVGYGRAPAASEVRRVVWTAEAVANLEQIAAYVSEFKPLAAQRLALRLQNAAESLRDHPERRRSAGPGRRLLATISPYLIYYALEGQDVVIITIRHGAREPE